jgi:hypothetical protein
MSVHPKVHRRQPSTAMHAFGRRVQANMRRRSPSRHIDAHFAPMSETSFIDGRQPSRVL